MKDLREKLSVNAKKTIINSFNIEDTNKKFIEIIRNHL